MAQAKKGRSGTVKAGFQVQPQARNVVNCNWLHASMRLHVGRGFETWKSLQCCKERLQRKLDTICPRYLCGPVVVYSTTIAF